MHYALSEADVTLLNEVVSHIVEVDRKTLVPSICDKIDKLVQQNKNLAPYEKEIYEYCVNYATCVATQFDIYTKLEERAQLKQQQKDPSPIEKDNENLAENPDSGKAPESQSQDFSSIREGFSNLLNDKNLA